MQSGPIISFSHNVFKKFVKFQNSFTDTKVVIKIATNHKRMLSLQSALPCEILLPAFKYKK